MISYMAFVSFPVSYSSVLHYSAYVALAISMILHYLVLRRNGLWNTLSDVLGKICAVAFIINFLMRLVFDVKFGYFYFIVECVCFVGFIWFPPCILLDKNLMNKFD